MFLSTHELEAGLELIRLSPKQQGKVELIVCRPDINAREELAQGELDLKVGLVGDNWLAKGYRKSKDGSAHPDMQLNIMNSRVISLIAKTKERWKLAGDQFFVDLDLSPENLPPGTQLEIGEAIIEVTPEPHLGCKKFVARFGKDAMVFVNSAQGKMLNLRGINTRVIKPGTVKMGATIKKRMA